MLKAFSYTGKPKSSVLGKELMEFYRPGKADNSSINSMRDQCCKFCEDSKGIRYKVPASRSLKYNREKNTLCKYRKMGGQEYMRAHKDIL